jgi:hypothetical protein
MYNSRAFNRWLMDYRGVRGCHQQYLRVALAFSTLYSATFLTRGRFSDYCTAPQEIAEMLCTIII